MFRLWARIFKDNQLLNSVEFQTDSVIIPYGLFMNCEGLKEVVLPPTVKEIRDRAFYQCYSLESINMEDVELIREQALGYSKLKKFYNSNPNLVVETKAFCNGVLTDVKLSPYAYIAETAFPKDTWDRYIESSVF